jgi:hypothetical protein
MPDGKGLQINDFFFIWCPKSDTIVRFFAVMQKRDGKSQATF